MAVALAEVMVASRKTEEGIRMGESRALLKTDIDIAERTIAITKSIDDLTGEEGPTKSGKSRTVDIPDEVIPVLQLHLARQAAGEPRVFGSQKRGAPLDPSALRNWLRRICRKAKVRPLPVHSTRHTFATLSLEAGVPLKEVSEALGHANVAITANTYSHAIEQRRRRAADAMGAVLKRRAPTPIRAIGSGNGTREDG